MQTESVTAPEPRNRHRDDRGGEVAVLGDGGAATARRYVRHSLLVEKRLRDEPGFKGRERCFAKTIPSV